MALWAVPYPSDAGASERAVDPGGALRVPSSFGMADTTFGIPAAMLRGGYCAREYFGGVRAQELDYRSKFFKCRQYDSRVFDMDGRMIGPSERGTFAGATPMLSSINGGAEYVPISARRPSAPYRLPKLIVKAFTGMIYGYNRWPQIKSTDQDTQAFCDAVATAANMRNRMVRGRDMAGSTGSTGFSWFFRKGQPRIRVHSSRFTTVLEWDDPDDFIPEHVTELYQTVAFRDGEDRQERYMVWVRRDWTKTADIVFKPVEVTAEDPSEWIIDEERSFEHGDGFCHFVTMSNFPADDEPGATDGVPDYDGVYEQMGAIDEMNSIFVRGVIRNLDPTLVLALNREEITQALIQKGSDNALIVGEEGSAEYLTIPADLVTASKTAIETQRGQVLETVQVVVLDPNDVAAAGLSSVAIKSIYAPMINASDLLREANGDAIKRLLEQMQKSARRRMGAGDEPPEVEDFDVDVEEPRDSLPGEEGGEVFEQEDLDPAMREQEIAPVEYYLDLKPRVVTEPELGEDGLPTGRMVQRLEPIKPGLGDIEIVWPDYFTPTTDDKQKATTATAAAAGGKPVMSQQSAVEETASIYNLDPTKEWERVQSEHLMQSQYEQGMFPPAGDGATATADPNAQQHTDVTTKVPDTSKPNAQDGLLTSTDVGKIVTVNEARASLGLHPLIDEEGQPDPDGQLTVAEFSAKRDASATVEGTDEGTEEADAALPPDEKPDDMDLKPPAPTGGGGLFK